MNSILRLPSAPVASSATRVVTLRPGDREELRSWLIDRAQTMLYPLTRSCPAQEELVLLDLRLRDGRLWLPATTRYTVPDHCGPIFVCGARHRSALALMIDEWRVPRRAHVRLPLSLPVLVRIDARDVQPAITRDLSAVGARLSTLLPLEPGGIALDFPPPRPPGFPAVVSARVVGRRGDDAIIHFSHAHERGWAEVRRWLRRVDETGMTWLPAACISAAR